MESKKSNKKVEHKEKLSPRTIDNSDDYITLVQ
jgi:hypothetical protein